MTNQSNTCPTCSKPFIPNPKEVKRGGGIYCSRNCFHQRSRVATVFQPNTTCFHCNKSFYRTRSGKMKSASGLQFCSRKCKEVSQTIESGVLEIRPSHYKDGSSMYRNKAVLNLESKCNRCGYDTHPEILAVHHKDKNHSNVKLSNLEILCPTCHVLHHFLERKGASRP